MIASGQHPLTTLVLTGERPDAFFYLLNHRVRAHLQDARHISDPTPLERHLDNLPLHCGQAARIRIGPQERPAAPFALLTAKPLLAITRPAIFHHGFTLTVRTPHDCFRHRLFSSYALS
jgi:hypothetical protein